MAILWGLWGFATSPMGRMVLIIAAFLAWTAYQRDQAADNARQECQAGQLQKVVDELTRQRDAARNALDNAEKQAAATQAEMADLEKSREETVVELADRGRVSCALPDDIRKRLHNIR